MNELKINVVKPKYTANWTMIAGMNTPMYTSTKSSLDCCKAECPPTPVPCATEAKVKAKGNKPMRHYDDCDVCCDSAPESDLSKTRTFLSNRVDSVYREQYSKLRKDFNMDSMESPNTFADFVAAVKADKMVLTEDVKDTKKFYSLYDMLGYVEFRDPTKVKDAVGFEAATAKVDQAHTDARDVIMTSSEADGLKVLQDFKSATFH